MRVLASSLKGIDKNCVEGENHLPSPSVNWPYARLLLGLVSISAHIFTNTKVHTKSTQNLLLPSSIFNRHPTLESLCQTKLNSNFIKSTQKYVNVVYSQWLLSAILFRLSLAQGYIDGAPIKKFSHSITQQKRSTSYEIILYSMET